MHNNLKVQAAAFAFAALGQFSHIGAASAQGDPCVYAEKLMQVWLRDCATAANNFACKNANKPDVLWEEASHNQDGNCNKPNPFPGQHAAGPQKQMGTQDVYIPTIKGEAPDLAPVNDEPGTSTAPIKKRPPKKGNGSGKGVR